MEFQIKLEISKEDIERLREFVSGYDGQDSNLTNEEIIKELFFFDFYMVDPNLDFRKNVKITECTK